MATTAIRGTTLIDGTGREPGRGVTVLIEGNRITDVGSDGQVDLPGEAHVIDGSGMTLLPGMIDCHVHLTINSPNLQVLMTTPPSLRILEAVSNLRKTLEGGFTTVRDAGGTPLGVKLAVERGIIPGPRMQISVGILSQTGGHGDAWTASTSIFPLIPNLPDIPNGVVDGIEPIRQRARMMLRAGADWIKLCTTGGVLSASDLPSSSQFTVEEIEVAVYEANADGGKRCMAHAQGTQGIKNALLAGVASIEHGIWLDDEAIEMMKQRGAYLVPTLVAPVQVLRQAELHPGSMPPWAIEKARNVVRDHQESFRRAAEAGVRVAMGTDSGVGPHGENAEEIVLMAENGMTPMQALVATTSRAAELLRMDDRIGTVEPGKLADLVLVDGNPLDDLRILMDRERIAMVMKDGLVYKDLTGSRSAARQPSSALG